MAGEQSGAENAPSAPNVSHLRLPQQYGLTGIAQRALEAAGVTRVTDEPHLTLLFEPAYSCLNGVAEARAAILAQVAEYTAN